MMKRFFWPGIHGPTGWRIPDSDHDILKDDPTIEKDLPENTDSDLSISTESPRGGEQLDELIKDTSIFFAFRVLAVINSVIASHL